ncbi:MAG TPA: alkaline phosphatase family protein [Blastocatellia bacterium]|nr:alkaline phosphatase family protein [Blastocatellia bacterium]
MQSKPIRQFITTSFSLLLVALLSLPPVGLSAYAQRQRGQRARVRLVVGIMIDQFRYDYLTRFEDQFGEGGFKRLMSEGAVFANANYPYTPTYTACGHAAFMSGTTPAHNGIIGNEWYDRETGRRMTSVSDEKVKLLGGKSEAGGASPWRLNSSTLGDQLKLHTGGQAKVVGISMKDRSAILPAGKHPNGAYWYDASNGAFVSSTYYFSDLPEWVKKFNREQNPDRYFGKSWERLLPEAAYARSLPDNYPYEKWPFGSNTFPHLINGGGETKPGPKFYSQIEYTPFANEQVTAFAKAAIENEALGKDDVPDLLTVSFSANDYVGHYFGPYSQEVQDITLRTDRILADFFNYLDQKIGLQNTIIVLTADHGVGPIPEHAREYGMGGRVEARVITEAIEAALSKRFGNDKWIASFVNGNVYFDDSAIERHQAARAEVERTASEAALKINGMAECFTRTQILAGQMPQTQVARSVAQGFNAARNGDLVLVPKPFWLVGEAIVASHGTPYNYDTHVPVIFYGAQFSAGVYLNPSAPIDIAPTLAAILKINPPSNSTGQVLAEAIKRAVVSGQ